MAENTKTDMISKITDDIIRRIYALGIFAYVGEDWGQLSEDQPSVSWPCALVDINEVDYSNASRRTQQAEAILTITVADVRHYTVGAQTPGDITARENSIHGYIQAVHNVVQGQGTPDYSPPMRKSMRKSGQWAGMKAYDINYTLAFTDSQPAPVTTPVLTNLDLEIGIQ